MNPNDFLYPSWAMLAQDYYDQRPDQLLPSYLLQPKLNGVRARWHHIERKFISRDGKVFPTHVLPHLYEQMLKYKPTCSFDGELYHYMLPFQTIAGMVTPNRNDTDENIHNICYYIFDIIDLDQLNTTRQERLRCFEPTENLVITPCKFFVHTKDDLRPELEVAVAEGYEGIMLRNPYSPYELGRTRNLLKMKPLVTLSVTIESMIEGTGKFKNMLGALRVFYPHPNGATIKFKIGGGQITTLDRAYIWARRLSIIGKTITIQFSEMSLDHKPLKAQILHAKEFYI